MLEQKGSQHQLHLLVRRAQPQGLPGRFHRRIQVPREPLLGDQEKQQWLGFRLFGQELGQLAPGEVQPV